MVVTADGEAASVYSTSVDQPKPLAVEASAFSVYPVWSPDGSRIAFGSGPDFDHTELTVADAGGSNSHGLGVQTQGTLAWSPDGTRLAYVRADEAKNGFDAVAIVGADGSDDRVIARGLEWQSVAWSPDGERLLLAGHPESDNPIAGPDGWDLYTVRIDGTDLVRLTQSEAFEHFALWSPDGSRIAFASSPNFDDADYPSDLWIMNADGSGERRLTGWRGFDSFPAWSPDGSYIAFASDRDATPAEQAAFENGEAFSGISLFVMRADGSGVRRLLMAEDGEALLPGSWKA
jgi:Tol biopolymer transport system component